MKVGRSFSLDEEISAKLNAIDKPSELINQLLVSYFAGNSGATETLDQKLKEIGTLEDQVLMEREKRRQALESEIAQKQEAVKKLDQESERQIQENITLIEAAPEVSKELLDYVRARKDLGLPIDYDFKTNSEFYDKLITFSEKYRAAGFRVGMNHIKTYLKFKGFFV